MKQNRRLIFILTITLISGIPSFILHAQSDYKLAEQDSLALVAFYNATDGPNWTSNQEGFGFDDLSTEWQDFYDGGFNPWFDGPAKDWFGVRVEKRPIPNSTDSAYRVTWLWPVIGRRTDGQNRLEGYVPREVGLLTALEQFRVNGNRGLEWTELPDDIYHPTLQHLDIEAAWFGGGISDQFRNCTDIRKMNFRYNYIDYMPSLDFLDEEAIYNLEGVQWFYSTRLSYAIIEKTIDYFYTISPNPKEFLIQARDLFDVGDEQEVVADIGSAVELECTAAGEQEEFITYQWYKNGLSMFGKTSRTLSISSVKESDYADYTVKITNDYVKNYDETPNYGEVFTKPFHLVSEPVPPELEWIHSSYNGKEIRLRLTKPMDPEVAGIEGFAIHTGSGDLTVISARTEGRLDRELVLTLSGSVQPADVVTLDYSGNAVKDQNGGILQPFSDSSVVNLVRQGPALVSAHTTRDGSGIVVNFDNYIDPASLNASDFQVTRTGNGEVTLALLAPGEIDEHISKSALLILSEPVTDSTETMSVQYLKGELAGLYSGEVDSSGETEVDNQISLELTEVVFTFEDGSKQLEDVLISGSWRVDPIQMYDDGSHGDLEPGDHIWTTTSALVDENYAWDVISRKAQTSYDTVYNEDPETGVITVILTPVELNNDSLLSESVVLEFEVAEKLVTGTTTFGIMNIPVTFTVKLENPSEEIFLMGINGDWGLGLPMTGTGTVNEYSVTVPGFTSGDLIEYNYREGDQWENQSMAPRSYTVLFGENQVRDTFGQFETSIPENALIRVTMFPNPVSGILHVEGLEPHDHLEIYSVTGKMMLQHEPFNGSTFQLDLSAYPPGIYLVKISSTQNNYNLLSKIIKF